jgi:heptosyltransferase-2
MAENILIRGVNWVGDAVMTLPAIRAVRRAYPDARLSLLVKPWVAPLFEKSPYIDEIILYDERFKGIGGKFALANTLKEKSFQKAILLQNAFDAALIAFMARIPERVGYNRDLRGMLLTNAVPYRREDRRMHHIEYFLNLLRSAGIDAPYSVPWLELSLDERLRARKSLGTLKRPVIGINPGAQFGPAKQWMLERFAALIDKTVNELGGSAVVFGGPAETGLAEDILKLTSAEAQEGRAVSMAGKTSLRELAALIAECDALVSTDSGPMHIGYATRTPLVAIFGSTEPSLTGPVGYGYKVIRHTLPCTPCYKRECTDREPMACMKAVTVNEVFEALGKVLPKKRAVFFDRDGTLCEYREYLSDWDNFRIIHDIDGLHRLIIKNYKLIGVTNQSGIARGLINEDFAREVNAVFTGKHGFTDFYHCPHHPDEHCACRKPEPEMLLRARGEGGIDLKRSFVVGDGKSDMLLARAVGARAVLIESDRADESVAADYKAKNLTDAVDWILRQQP